MDHHGDDVIALRPWGIQLLQNDLRLMVFLELDIGSIPNVVLASKAWSNTYLAHQTYINRNIISRVIGHDNMSIAFARHAASRLTWAPSPIHGFSSSCSLQELPGKIQEFGVKYLAHGAEMPSDVGYTLARNMLVFHQHVQKWSANIAHGYWQDVNWGRLTDREKGRFDNAVYIMEVLRLLFPVSLDDRDKDSEIYRLLCSFFAPWKLCVVHIIEYHIATLFTIYRRRPRILIHDSSTNKTAIDIFTSLGVQGISQNCIGYTLKRGLALARRALLQAHDKPHYTLQRREQYRLCLDGTTWLGEKGFIRELQCDDIEKILRSHPESDSGPADLWIFELIHQSPLAKKLPDIVYHGEDPVFDRKTLDNKYEEPIPSTNEMIEILKGARIDYVSHPTLVFIRAPCALNCVAPDGCIHCEI